MQRFIAISILHMARAAFPETVAAQARVISSCTTTCPLQLSHIASLGDTTGLSDGFVGEPQAIARTRTGEFLLADRYDQDKLKRFSADGTYLGHVGRRGKGPGEFEVLQFLTILPGDSIETYDLGQRRVTVFAPGWEPIRTIDIGTGALEMVRLPDGSRVIAGYRYEPERIGLPLHHIDAQGEMRLSFGAHPPVSDLRQLHVFYRQIARGSSDGSIWAAHVPQYRLEEWSVDGKILDVLERHVDWFTPSQKYGYMDDKQPPSAGIRAIHYDDNGILWILINVADADWRSGLGPREDPYGRTYVGIVNRNQYFDSVIEAIDPVEGKLLGTIRIDNYAIGFSDDGLLFGYAEARNGEPFIPVWRVTRPQELRSLHHTVVNPVPQPADVH